MPVCASRPANCQRLTIWTGRKPQLSCRDIASDFPQQRWRNVSALVKGYGRTPAIRVSKLFVGTALADFHQPDAVRMATTSGGLRTGTAMRQDTCTVGVPTNSASR